MAIGYTSACKYFACVLTAQVVMTIFGPLRFYLLRSQLRKRSRFALCSDVLFIFAWISVMGHGWYLIPYAWAELQERKRFNEEYQVILSMVDEDSLRTFLVYYVLFITEIWAFKMAFTFMYADLYSRAVAISKRGLYFAFGFVPLTFVGLMLAVFLECRPLSQTWDVQRLFENDKLCSPLFSFRVNVINVICTICTDIVLILLQLHILTSLSLSNREKGGIAFIFVIACISVTAAVGRFVILVSRGVYRINGQGEGSSFDKYYWAMGLSFLEICAAEVAFVLPALRKVLLGKMKYRSEESPRSSRQSQVDFVNVERLLSRQDQSSWRGSVEAPKSR